MGLPMVQVVMIMARQMSKPVADVVMRYGKNHPLFRNKVLIPVGRGLVNLTTRLRMKHLGLGKPTSVAQVSETAALEQASEFVQQVVIFGYTVGVFYAYQVYSKSSEVPIANKEDIKQIQIDFNTQISELNCRVDRLSAEVRQLAESKNSSWWNWSNSSMLNIMLRTQSERNHPSISRQEAMQIISKTTPATARNIDAINAITDDE